jgi:hypothetical protein
VAFRSYITRCREFGPVQHFILYGDFVPSRCVYSFHVQPQEAILPGIFFVYELSPFMIEASRTRMPILHFFTKVCAIVGGVFTVLGVLDSILFRLQKLASLKNR